MLYITVTNERQNKKLTHASGPLALGRAPLDDCEGFSIVDRFVSRDQIRIEETPSGRLSLRNNGAPITLFDQHGTSLGTMAKDEVREMSMPVEVNAGYTKIRIDSDTPASPDESFRTLERPIRASNRERPNEPSVAHSNSSLLALGRSPDSSTLAKWFETLLAVQKSAGGSSEFYDETARAVVELVGLDCGLVVLLRGGRLDIKAKHIRSENYDIRVSRTVINFVQDQQRTFYQTMPSALQGESLYQVEAVVASPIFNQQDEVVGVVYGSRDLRKDKKGRGIESLEAQVVQLLAGTVTAGLARVEKETEAARLRVQIEQIVSPEVAGELERNPKLLDGAERQITVLFADLRGFSRIAERLGARDSFRLVGDVMDRLTNVIMDRGGSVIDYYGDGIAAMWNAPTDQADHMIRASDAAIQLQDEMPTINEHWSELVGEALRIGVGIHTGVAQVGNAGSQRRIKYGPRGHTVNLASRIEGATKLFGGGIIVSGATEAGCRGTFLTRRLRKVKVVNIDHPVELHELHGRMAEPQWQTRRDAYERALSFYELSQFEPASRLLTDLLQEFPDDKATRLLLEHAQHPLQPFDPVWRLDSK